jgi:hypothetical protein
MRIAGCIVVRQDKPKSKKGHFMLKGILFSIVIAAIGASAASAEDWTGQTPPPPASGTLGPLPYGGFLLVPATVVCGPFGTPPPCTAGQTPEYGSTNTNSSPASLPAGADTTLGIYGYGYIADPNAPAGISYFEAHIPLEDFAKSSTVDSLATTVNGLGGTVNGLAASVNGLSSQMQTLSTGFAQLQQQLAIQDRSLRQGVAMSLAMDGTGTLGPDEHFAMSMNWGTFGGQNGVAGSVAVRAADHLTFDGGIGTGLHGGLVGARAGVRIAW